jgi:hypothetical protein
MLLLLALAAVLWIGCGKDPATITAPASESEQATSLGKPAVNVAKVMAVQDRHTEALMAIRNVVGTATTQLPDGRYAVKILTKVAGMEGSLPRVLENLPVVVEEVGEIRALSFTGKYSPVPAGVSVGNRNECSAGTDGCVVQNSSGTRYFLSNNHVFARENDAAIGEDIVQPGLFDSQPQCDPNFPNHVADLSNFVRIRFGFGGRNRVDAAIAQIRSDVSFTCATICGYTPGSPVSATVGMSVKKCGRTTELTTGTVTGVNVTVFVQYSSGIARFTGQIQTGPMSSPGDSGSLLLRNNSAANAVGLLFAGSSNSTIYNRIQEVLSAFNASICTN